MFIYRVLPVWSCWLRPPHVQSVICEGSLDCPVEKMNSQSHFPEESTMHTHKHSLYKSVATKKYQMTQKSFSPTSSAVSSSSSSSGRYSSSEESSSSKGISTNWGPFYKRKHHLIVHFAYNNMVLFLYRIYCWLPSPPMAS